MNELKAACREAYLNYIHSGGRPQERAIYASVVARYVKALKAAGPEAINAYYAWCQGARDQAPDLTQEVKAVEKSMELRNA